jgi:hypothetical protein
MEATGDSTFYKITKAHYGKLAFRVLGFVLEMLTMAALWILASFLLERFIPFRNGSLVETPHQWFIRSAITGALWAVLMTLWSASRRNQECEVEIRPDRVIKYGTRDTDVIYSEELSVFREVRRFGRVRGFALMPKRQQWFRPHYLFIPARHPQYAEIKERLEIWQAQAAR